MDPVVRTITCAPIARLAEAIREACGAPSDWRSTQVEYLCSYLAGEPGARALIIETPYVDRHYLEEYSAYYVSAFRNGGSVTTRIHVFSIPVDDAQVRAWIHETAAGAEAYEAVQRRVDDAYLGFIVVRPLPSAPIGRTVLRPYRGNTSRSYIPREGGHEVHLFGLTLVARGLPFQQQDQAVGACATTALWSALSRVARADGGRAPTPYAVTQAATQHYLADRVLPAVSGLELAQFTSAVRGLGYAPYVLHPTTNHEAFLLSLKCYLQTGIPALLVLMIDDGYHAVTVSGYRVSDDEEAVPDLHARIAGLPHALRARGMSRVYVHDDRFGPYVRMRLVSGHVESGVAAEAARDEIALERIAAPGVDPLANAGGIVCYAVLPLYPKLRLSAREMIGIAVELRSMVWTLLDQSEREQLNFETFFVQSGRYQSQLMRSGFGDVTRLEAFVRTVSLPRYVGVIRFQLGELMLLDVLCDTTDITRDCPRRSAVLAALPSMSSHVEPLRRAFASVGASWVIVS